MAIPPLGRAVALGENDAHTLVALGDAYFGAGDAVAAARAFEQVVVLLPESGRAKVKLAHALIYLGRAAEAETLLRQAIDQEPEFSASYDLLAFLLPQLGRFEEAQQYATKALSIDPNHAGYWARYAYGAKVTSKDEEIVNRFADLSQLAALNARDRIRIEFALGKANEDLGRYAAAAEHFVRANALSDEARSKRGEGFDRISHQRDVDLMIETFPAVNPVEGASNSDLPVFVVGMMRSGSTLTEQIISSHPEVGGANEVPFWIEHAPALLRTIRGETALASVRSTTENYVGLLQRLAPGKRRVCDKLLQNYMALGVLHSVLPNARIVHCRRDPRDTCLSVFTTPCSNPPPFAYRADAIAFAYAQYLRLMAHWRKVLPEDRFLEIDYEELVTDRERVSRRMIDFIGLEWNEACLYPEGNPRPVGNPSQWQVRQPVYGTSIGRWRRFEPWLGPQLEQWDFAT
jgi:tetratricopeptide (TPR) repeat protein